MKIIASSIATLIFSIYSVAQNVAINTDGNLPDSSSILDIQSARKGLLVPRMLASERSLIAGPAKALLIYQKDGLEGFYYNQGTPEIPSWIYLGVADNNKVWLTNGNAGTTAGTNFIGTTNSQAFIVKTNGIAVNNERIRFLTTPQIVVNRVSSQSGDLFSVYGTNSSGALNSISGQTDFPINGYSAGAFGGVYGENNGTGQGVLGSNSSTGVGVYGANNNVNGFGVSGVNTAAGVGVLGSSLGGIGVNGTTNSTTNPGVRGVNTNTSGTGIIALGNNITSALVYTSGSGLAANGSSVGIYAVGTNVLNGIGVIGVGNNVTTISTTGSGEGITGIGSTFGIAGFATSALSNNRWAGYFDYVNSVNGYLYVGGRSSNTDYAFIAGAGAVKSGQIKGLDGENRIIYCTESPEVLLEDFGTGQLTNGKAHIKIDPVLTKNIYVSEEDKKPLRVFVTLEGDCKGVFVSNKTTTGFDVTELSGGSSNVKFTWQIVANRADATDDQGR